MKYTHIKSFVLGSLLFAAMLFSTPLFAADIYKIDSAHSTLGFSVQHLMVSRTTGTFDQYEGTITFDPHDLAVSKIDVTIQVTSINTRVPKRDDHLRSADFFDVATQPTITFKSKEITGEAGQYTVKGELTIKGVTKAVEVPLTINGPAQNPYGGKVIGVSSQFKLNRQDYGISWNKALDTGGFVVGDEVSVDINVEAKTE